MCGYIGEFELMIFKIKKELRNHFEFLKRVIIIYMYLSVESCILILLK